MYNLFRIFVPLHSSFLFFLSLSLEASLLGAETMPPRRLSSMVRAVFHRQYRKEIVRKYKMHTTTNEKFGTFFKPVLKQLQRAIPTYPSQALACPFPVWKTITIGGKNPEELMAALERNGIRVSFPARPFLRSNILATLPKPQSISLVRTTFMDIGYTEQPTREELYNVEWLSTLGLDICPAEIVPHLMLQYPDEQYNLDTFVVMEPITYCNYGLPNYNVFLNVLDAAGNTVPWPYADVPEYIDSVVFQPVRSNKNHKPRLTTDGEYDGKSITWKPDHELIFAARL